MAKFDAKAVLEARLNELGKRIVDIDALLQQPLSADFEDQANDLEDHEALEAIEDATQREVKSIQFALNRIKTGKYGICVSCGNPIPEARLEAVPTALRCMACETAK